MSYKINVTSPFKYFNGSLSKLLSSNSSFDMALIRPWNKFKSLFKFESFDLYGHYDARCPNIYTLHCLCCAGSHMATENHAQCIDYRQNTSTLEISHLDQVKCIGLTEC